MSSLPSAPVSNWRETAIAIVAAGVLAIVHYRFSRRVQLRSVRRMSLQPRPWIRQGAQSGILIIVARSTPQSQRMTGVLDWIRFTFAA